MEKRNKLWRKRHQWRLFKARMILHASCDIVGACGQNGVYIERPHWFELAKQRWSYVYKTTGTPCSCCLCKGLSYNRKDYKKETKRILKESFE